MKHNSAAVVVILVLTFLTNPSLTAKEKGQYRIGSFAKYLQIVGASKVGSDNCATCHSEEAGDFKHAFHGQRGIECEDCHGAGSLHVDSSGEVSKILSFRSRPAEAANGVCLSCHARDEKVRNWLAGSHAADRVRCADCHHVHSQQPKGEGGAGMNFDALTPGRAALAEKFVPESSVKLAPRWQANDSCLRCHRSQRAEMLLPYHHPLREGKMSCTDCHDPHGGPAGKNLRTATINQLCLSCHAQYRGPFMYQHPPVNENCLNCHASHGSPNTNLLSVSIPALCLQCHSGHHDGAGLPLVDRCTNCHGSIHGTDVPTPTGGSRFVDKGGLGVPGFPQPSAAGGLNRRSGSAALRPLPAHASTLPARLVPNHAIVASSGVVPTRYLSPMPSDALFA
ncbi:MAG TPA: DmsE family decaheme c-type cytochrome, partial [Acidobacteriota bacterium]|nr:DmsE family decaheme c-type cytochrome [Acidobacteriota bacterium]